MYQSKTIFFIITDPLHYATPKKMNGKTFILQFSPLLKIDSDKITSSLMDVA